MSGINNTIFKAIEEFLKFGPPREGSLRYHKAWKSLKEEFEKEDYIRKNPPSDYDYPLDHSNFRG